MGNQCPFYEEIIRTTRKKAMKKSPISFVNKPLSCKFNNEFYEPKTEYTYSNHIATSAENFGSIKQIHLFWTRIPMNRTDREVSIAISKPAHVLLIIITKNMGEIRTFPLCST